MNSIPTRPGESLTQQTLGLHYYPSCRRPKLFSTVNRRSNKLYNSSRIKTNRKTSFFSRKKIKENGLFFYYYFVVFFLPSFLFRDQQPQLFLIQLCVCKTELIIVTNHPKNPTYSFSLSLFPLCVNT